MKLSATTVSMIALVASASVFLSFGKEARRFESLRRRIDKSSSSTASRKRITDSHHRGTQAVMIGDFVPLSCNANLKNAPCQLWSQRFGTSSYIEERIFIPCGECIIMDHKSSDSTLTLYSGIDVRGKLVLEDNYSLTIFTKLIAVQGQLDILSTKPVDGTPSIRIVLTGQEDQSFVPVGENRFVCDFGSLCDVGKKVVVVAGGQVNIHGLPPNTPTWTRLYDVVHKDGEDFQAPSTIVVDAAVKQKWVEGAEIMITSHTREWNGHQVRKIVRVSDYSERLVQIELDSPIRRPTTIVESSDFAVEVALLSRNIVIEGGKDDFALHGGHFWIMNTPSVVQTVEGVDFRNCGQQGLLGRYPIHIHLCGDMTGSRIAKNTIRQSNQRCVVVHNTHNLLVEENVAYDTKGHCFIVEEGMETGNKFLRNLGAQTGAVEVVIPDNGFNGIETDDNPSTFWMTTPTNVWIGNVAAGSQGAGYWFELQLRGMQKYMFPDLNPKSAPIIKFENNVAHSNNDKGFRTYPTGYLPDEVQTFSGMKSYRNSGAGVFLHISRKINVERALVADNRNIGIDIDRADSIRVLDSEVIGESLLFRELLAMQDVQPSCVEDALYGIQLHTWKHDPSNGGVVIRNVSLRGFNNTHCSVGLPFHIDSTIKTGQFNLYTALSKVKMDDAPSFIDFCEAESAGVVDIYLTDLDGSFRPPGISTNGASTLLSRNANMLNFVDRSLCTPKVAKCYSYCTNTCFRSVRFSVDPASTADTKLRVCQRNATSNCIEVYGKQRVDDGYDLSFEHRVFLAHLPFGEYEASFIQGDSETWPSFVYVEYEEPTCAASFQEGAIRLKAPPTLNDECDSLIRNGRLELSNVDPTFWTYRFGGIQVLVQAGMDRSNAMAGIERTDSTTLSQYLDSRCLKQHKGHFYEIMADVRLENPDGSPFTCDPRLAACPEIGIFTPEVGFRRVAAMDSTTVVQGYQSIHDFVKDDEWLATVTEARLDIRSNVNGKRMLVDNVVMRRVQDEALYCQNVILASSTDPYRYWRVTDNGALTTASGLISASGSVFTRQALRLSGRRSYDEGMAYTGWRSIELACLKPGSRWNLTAQFQLVQRGTNRGVPCNTETCPVVRVVIRDANGNQVVVERFDTWITNPNKLNIFQEEVKLPPRSLWDGSLGNVLIDIRSFSTEYDLIVGDFSMNML